VTRSDRELVRDALEHIRMLHHHLERLDLADETVADAVSLRLAAAIESLSTASPIPS
jgi:predicted small metal-binding protein